MVTARCSLSTEIMTGQRLDQACTAELIDGSVILLRQLEPSDAEDILALYESLTDEERYFRFFAMHPAYLDQYSLGAYSAGKLLGVANYVALEGRPGYAEVAVVVAHAEHLRGVGTALLRRLGEVARTDGLNHLVAEVLFENHLMLRVLSETGWPCTRHLEGSVLHVEIDLGAEPAVS